MLYLIKKMKGKIKVKVDIDESLTLWIIKFLMKIYGFINILIKNLWLMTHTLTLIVRGYSEYRAK